MPRVSINYGLRFDRFTGNVPAQSLAASEFIPFQRDFAAVNDVLGFNDVNPRLGVSYDLFGNGRTALKFAVGKYVEGTVGRLVSRLNPISTSVTSARRTWNDANGNFRPDCDLVSIAANGECGAVDDQNFGQNNPKATQYADNVVRGWGRGCPSSC